MNAAPECMQILSLGRHRDRKTSSGQADVPVWLNYSGGSVRMGIQSLYRYLTEVRSLLLSIPMIPAMSRDLASYSYFPEQKQKPHWRMLFEQLSWLLQNNEINTSYHRYGFDIEGKVNQTEYMPYRAFMHRRNDLNRDVSRGFDYVCLLRDKFVFGQYLISLGFPTPQNLAVGSRTGIRWLPGLVEQPLQTLVSRSLDVFCKDISGEMGAGVFALKVSDEGVFVDGQPCSYEHLVRLLPKSFIVQQRIVQHSSMSMLYDTAVNTIRLVTVNSDGEPRTFAAALRVGANGGTADNPACGGLAVNINQATGRLEGAGVFTRRGRGQAMMRVQRHPNSGVLFDGFAIPHFQAAVSMALSLHKYLYGIHSIGWDIAIAEDGPIFIEGNDNWGISLIQGVSGGLRHKFVEEFRRPGR